MREAAAGPRAAARAAARGEARRDRRRAYWSERCEARESRWRRHSLAKRLYLRIYCALLACLMLTALLFAGVMRWSYDSAATAPRLEVVAEAAAGLLPPATASFEAQAQALRHWHERAGLDLALFDAQRAPIASAGRALDAPPPEAQSGRWLGSHPPRVALRLADGRWLVARAHTGGFSAWTALGLLGLTALAVGFVAFPVARRLTRRLERLQKSVEALGEGDLAARVPVEGRDEIAQLAISFNRAAEHIEGLVAAQKSLLANASHELRSPLARIRMAAELDADAANTKEESEARARELARNIAELDQLIDEILLASRLDATGRPEDHFEHVDLTALVAEECARAEVEFESEGVIGAQGEARLLRRLTRNLIENARRYGGAATVEVHLRRDADGAILEVADRGPGVAEDERERIFEPFYRARGASEGQGGVGLGLALVRQIATRHGAEVACLARPGGGSVFRVGGLREA